MNIFKLLGGGKLKADYIRYKSLRRCGFAKLFLAYPEFRYQFYYRLREHSNLWKILLKPLQLGNSHNLYLNSDDIEGGLFIEHGFSTIIACRHIGANCWINQQVTIGYSDATNCPYIGNNVHIKAGAKVIGNVRIGDDVIIGANAVVVNDVPSHSIVVGVPARIIKVRSHISDPWRSIVSIQVE